MRLIDFPRDSVTLDVLHAVTEAIEGHAARYGVAVQFSGLDFHAHPSQDLYTLAFSIAVDKVRNRLQQDFGDWQVMFRNAEDAGLSDL